MKTLWHRHPGVRSGDELTFGERAADAMRSGMGSWTFVFGFIFVMAVWMFVNTGLHIGGKQGFDRYPYVLLNLILSTMAGLQAAALLIAAKRADQVSSEVAIHTETNTDDLKTLLAKNIELTEQVKKNTDLLNAIYSSIEKHD